jgi:Tol biopolymer transport system component
LDREANRLLTTQGKQEFRLHLVNLEKPSADRVLADASSVAFAPDGKLVFSSPMSGNDEIWSVDADGGRQRQLTNNPADEYVEVVSPDGRSIFFSSNRTGEVHVWRMNVDGSDQTQITQKEGGKPVLISTDGRWVYYHHALQRTLWRVPTTPSGEEQLVLDEKRERFAFSPDGSRVAFLDTEGGEDRLKVISLADRQNVKTFTITGEVSNAIQLKWAPDGENLAYILGGENENKVLWFQPLNGMPPRQIASLGEQQIALYGFDISPDGRQAAVVKGGWRYDAVLITGLR